MVSVIFDRMSIAVTCLLEVTFLSCWKKSFLLAFEALLIPWLDTRSPRTPAF